jgi:methylated-DNA-protein-cysteine methyltransferase-like protein
MKRSRHNFYQDVYDVVCLIPAGRVSTYGAIARYLGETSGARMVGYALGASFGQVDIPAQRVVNRQGLLTGKHHFPADSPMAERLRQEGVVVVDDQVQQFDTVFWDPLVELL